MSNATRSVQLTFENQTGITLAWSQDTNSGDRLACEPSASSVKDGKTITLSASSTSAACKGTVTFHTDDKSATPCLVVAYCASSDSDKTGLTISPCSGFGVGPQSVKQTDHSIAGTFTFYPGILQSADSTVQVMSLSSDPMTLAASVPHVFADFTNAMFDPQIRSTDAITAAVTTATTTITNQWDADSPPPIFYADFTGGQIPVIVAMWKKYWIDRKAESCPAPDAALIDWLKGFLTANGPPQLWIPRLTVHDAGPPAVFNLKGYNAIDFHTSNGDWIETTVERFLTMLASGAHFVSICAKSDLEPIGKSYSSAADFYASFADASFVRGNDLGNSHYISSGIMNTSGWYFLDIDGEWMPSTVKVTPNGDQTDAGLINALMTGASVTDPAGRAVNGGQYSPFLQLEGWQQQGTGGGDRHMADYDSYNSMLWNISTFGASPYSEKRGTTVFLAPKDWTPQVTEVTRMMPYVGAYASAIPFTPSYPTVANTFPQAWLNTGLVRIDDDSAAKLDYQFVHWLP